MKDFKINEKTYLSALDVVRAYLKQIELETTGDKMLVEDWIILHRNRISKRLFNTLYNHCVISDDSRFKYLHQLDVNVYKFRNTGRKTIKELENMLGRNLK